MSKRITFNEALTELDADRHVMVLVPFSTVPEMANRVLRGAEVPKEKVLVLRRDGAHFEYMGDNRNWFRVRSVELGFWAREGQWLTCLPAISVPRDRYRGIPTRVWLPPDSSEPVLVAVPECLRGRVVRITYETEGQ